MEGRESGHCMLLAWHKPKRLTRPWPHTSTTRGTPHPPLHHTQHRNQVINTTTMDTSASLPTGAKESQVRKGTGEGTAA